MTEEKKIGLSGNALKIIASMAMLIDHSAIIILDAYLDRLVPFYLGEDELSMFFSQNPGLETLNKVSIIMHLIGRFAFPLYAFLIIEGYEHTRSIKNYAKNLAIFALISEIPYDIAFEGKVIAPGRQNVIFTLLFGVLCITFVRYLQKNLKKDGKNILTYGISAVLLGLFFMHMILTDYWFIDLLEGKIDRNIFFIAGTAIIFSVTVVIGFAIGSQKRRDFVAAIIPLVLFGMAGDILNTSYGACGVTAIFIMYLLKKKRNLAFVFSMLILGPMGANEIFAILTIIPVLEYNGERGAKMNKYFFYAFYPVHLILLYLISLIVGISTFTIY